MPAVTSESDRRDLQILTSEGQGQGHARGQGSNSCARRFLRTVFSVFGVVFVLILYVLGCAVVFSSLESGNNGNPGLLGRSGSPGEGLFLRTQNQDSKGKPVVTDFPPRSQAYTS